MKKFFFTLFLITASRNIVSAADLTPDFSKYDFTKLDPKPVEIKSPLIIVNVWDRCTQCDCPEKILDKVESEDTKDAVTIRLTSGTVKEKFTITGTQKDDVILITKNTDDCKVDTVVTVQKKLLPHEVPCDKNCADPVLPKKSTLDVNLNKPAGCQSNGPTILLLPFLVLFFRRKVTS